MKVLFWISLVGATYSYLLYPIVLLVLPKRRRTQRKTPDMVPNVSVIITAYNEERRIRDKLVNTLQIDYPRQKIEIIVASDASSDRTDDIVRDFKDAGVRLVRSTHRKGKEHAQGLAIREAAGEVLIFSDVATRIPPDSVHKLVPNFSDAQVGAVSSEDRFITREGHAVGEGAYVKYEMWLRRLESDVNSLVGLSGSFFAARRKICSDWDIHVPSDSNVALNCIRQGYVAISDPEVLGIYTDVKDDKQEYQRKVRTVIRGLAAVFRRLDILNPLAFGFFAFQLWSHKVMRWIVPWCLILLLASSAILSGNHWVYTAFFIAQMLFYGLAVAGLLSTSLQSKVVAKIPAFFLQTNTAVGHATILFLLGKRMTTWTPSER